MLALAMATWLVAAPAAVQPGEAVADLAGHWEGAIATVTGDLVVRVDLERTTVGWRGTIDIPQQGAEGLALSGIAVEALHVRFTLADVPGAPTFDGDLVEGELRGTFTQTGSRLPFRLGRAAVPGPARPQEPRPPFAYRAEEVRVRTGEVELAGTLTLPAGSGPFPAIVLLSGSGAQDRDGAILGHRPLAVLADALARRGVAALRCDDRGVGGSAGSLGAATTEVLAGDALAAVDFLSARSDIGAGRVGLLGHSEGGLVASLAASRRPEVAFVVLLATPGVPGRELLPLQ
ncbi:MAG: alpha/beta hydrolase family protein, partial [Thermoanaerobaculia bacterium]